MYQIRCHALKSAVLALLVVAALAGAVIAAPMFGEVKRLRQPDGTRVEVKIFGDEYYQDVESLDGYTLVRDPATNVICYAKLSADGNEYVSTGVRVGTQSPASLGLSQGIRIPLEIRHAKAEQQRAMAYAPELEKRASLGGGQVMAPPDNGNVKGLVLLADFSDQVATISVSEVDNFCNQVGYNGNGNNGSVRDYFFDVSDGNLTYTNYVTPTYYRPANDFAWYDDCDEPWLGRGKQLILEILNQMEADGFDFSDYDSNGDGDIDAVNLFYAGDVGCGWAKGMWPGSGSMSGFSADGVSVNRFQLTDMGSALTIRTFCHENGHMICYYPDLYDYDDDSNGVGNYCLMGSGASNTNPCEVSAPLKQNSGWGSATDLVNKATGLSVPAGTNSWYQYTRGFNVLFPGENFLVENRQKTGRDAAIPDAGLLIWHVEEVFGDHNKQQMTIFEHFPYTVMQADNDWDLENDVNSGDADDLYSSPGSTALTPCTEPNTNWWDGSASGFSLTNASAIGANMTFDFSPDDDDPIAQVQAYQADADEDCCIQVAVTNINNGSYDPDGPGDIASLFITAVDGNPVTPTASVEVCGDGDHTVTLTITDLCGNTDSEVATVTVVNSPPVAVAKDASGIADDNCCIVVHLADIDGGTYDPDGASDIETFCITSVDGTDVGCVDSVTVCGNGDHEFVITATDYCGYADSDTANVEVIDITPPDIAVELDRDALWPPNHKMVEICAAIEVTDNCDPDPDVALVSITSDEPDNDKGDGNTDDDIQNDATGTEDLCFDLRSERQGTEDGRTYTIIYSATDDSGNAGYDTVYVNVPHDMGAGALASTGYIADGSAIEDGLETFAVIIPSTTMLNATKVDLTRIYLGNTAGVVRPSETRFVDVNADSKLDLAVFFPAAGATALASPTSFNATEDGVEGGINRKPISDGPLGVHFVSNTGVDYLVGNIYTLGEPVPMPMFSVIDDPTPFVETPKVEPKAAPKVTAISSINPNPFNPQTAVLFTLASSQRVRISVYDVRGSLVRSLVDQTMPAGDHRVEWNGVDEAGRGASSGIYFVRMIAGSYSETRKIVMLK